MRLAVIITVFVLAVGLTGLIVSYLRQSEVTQLQPVDRPVSMSGQSSTPDTTAGQGDDVNPLQKTSDKSEDGWESIQKNDVSALYDFLASHSDSHHAEKARTRIRELDQLAWQNVMAETGAFSQLSAIEAYVENFPDGERLNEAQQLEAAQLSTIFEGQDLLSQLGYFAGEQALTHEAVRLAIVEFQEQFQLPVTGDLDSETLTELSGRLEDPVPTAIDINATDITDELAEPTFEKTPEGVAEPWDLRPFRDCPTCPELVRLPPGKFLMGDISGLGDRDEQPVHAVEHERSIAIGRYEVTFEEWDVCVEDGACPEQPNDNGWGRGRRPVMNVTAKDAQEYVGWLVEKTGHNYRLPSEAEWEYAARAGAYHPYAFGDDISMICKFGNGADARSNYRWRNQACEDDYPDRSAPVGSFAPNAFGLSDMMGNVWEWVGDCWHDNYASAPTDGSVWETDCDRTDNVLRGGAYSVDTAKLRLSYRYAFADGKRMPFFGFRVARDENRFQTQD